MQIKIRTSALLMLSLAVMPVSPNYQLRDYELGGSGGVGTGSNYQAELGTDPTSGQAVGSTVKSGLGLSPTQQANVPAAPTLANPANYYNRLLATLNPGTGPTDTEYAIAISDDDFATASYVQSNTVIGTALGDEDWQTYSAWGSANGTLILGLSHDSTYKVKAAARHGDFTETAFGPTSAAIDTNDTVIGMTISGVASGTNTEGIVTDITSTATAASFGTLISQQKTETAQQLTVTANATDGYTALIQQEGALATAQGASFPTVSGTNQAPSSWPSSPTSGAYGYHTSDESLGTGTTTRFSADATYAAFAATAAEVAYSAAPVVDETTTLVIAIETGRGQAAGSYTHTVRYTIYGRF